MTNFRRFFISLLAATAVLAVVPVLALGTAQQVIEDYEDDGQIQGCYSNEDFNRAVKNLDPTDALYGTAAEIIRLAQARCAESGAASDDDGGSGAGVWIGIVIAVGLVALGAGALSRRGRSGAADGATGSGPHTPAGGDSDSGQTSGDSGGGRDGGGAGGDGG